METNTRTLSARESKVVLGLEWAGQDVVAREEIVSVVGDAERANKIIASLCKKRWLERIGQGRYLLIPAQRGPEGVPETNALRVGKHLADPYYFGYTTAAAFYRFTPQSRTTVWIVTPKNVLDRTIRETEYCFVNLVERKFFGFAPVTVYGEQVNMSDPEKTVLDCVDKVHKAGGFAEVARIIVRAAPKFDWDKLATYAQRFVSVALVQRFGYLTSLIGAPLPPDARQRLRANIKRNSRSFLDATGAREAAVYNAEWQVLVNVPEKEIRSDL